MQITHIRSNFNWRLTALIQADPLGQPSDYKVVTLETYFCIWATTLPELITFSLSRTTVEVSHVDAGEDMVPGPFHLRN
jgi:hypothetical protein